MRSFILLILMASSIGLKAQYLIDQFNISGLSTGFAFEMDNDSQYIYYGGQIWTGGQIDSAVIAKYDNTGAIIWLKQLTPGPISSSKNWVEEIYMNTLGELYAVTSSNREESTGMVYRLDPNTGDELWQTKVDARDYDHGANGWYSKMFGESALGLLIESPQTPSQALFYGIDKVNGDVLTSEDYPCCNIMIGSWKGANLGDSLIGVFGYDQVTLKEHIFNYSVNGLINQVELDSTLYDYSFGLHNGMLMVVKSEHVEPCKIVYLDTTTYQEVQSFDVIPSVDTFSITRIDRATRAGNKGILIGGGMIGPSGAVPNWWQAQYDPHTGVQITDTILSSNMIIRYVKSKGNAAYAYGSSFFKVGDLAHVVTSVPYLNKVVPNELTIYPNPVTDAIHITTNGQVKKVMIYDVLGKLHYQSVKFTSVLSVKSLTSGFYFVTIIYSDNSIQTQKFFVK